jgi:hypothetical protein
MGLDLSISLEDVEDAAHTRLHEVAEYELIRDSDHLAFDVNGRAEP